VDLKRVLGLALCAVAFALIVWGLFFAKFPGGVVSIKVDLPPASTPAPKPIDVFIDTNGAIQVNGRPSNLDALARDVAAQSTAQDKSRQEVRIRATESVKYETFIAVTKRLKDSGWSKVGLLQEAIGED
jgi:biopolymer transport protein ExbD